MVTAQVCWPPAEIDATFVAVRPVVVSTAVGDHLSTEVVSPSWLFRL